MKVTMPLLTNIHLDFLKLKAARMRAGYSLSEVATALQVTPVAISNIERGVNLPAAETLIRLCSLYGVDLAEIKMIRNAA